MRNLKRVLSLALALVMVIGMMVMGAGAASADFGDAAEIDYTEAVDVISGLGIMIGDDQGNFNAKDTLTREQAAKIICYAMIGAENAEKLGKNTQIFNDVAAGRWSAGYIAYCANLGLLVGYGNGSFGPTDTLTGVQFGKLLLVAAGYNAETQGYTGADWATNIATDMINNGLDIKGVVMSDALTREQAAQMLLQAMDMNTVTYTTGNVVGMIGPYTTGKTFAETYFEDLEKIDGVITANEYADLYSGKALKAGKTEIDGTVYAGSTEITDIGMSVKGWANDGEILYLADSGKNTVFETGAKTDIATSKKFEKATGLKLDDATESFLNFGDDNGAYTSDYRIEYTLKFDDAAAVAAFEKEYDVKLTGGTTATGGSVTYNEIFKVGAKISANDMAIIKGIFYSADKESNGYVIGEVYVGTKSTEDVSDKISYKSFFNTYIDDATAYADIDGTVNGDWLKVIDNDGDGKADFVFKTQFAMTEVTNVTKKGVYTLAALDEGALAWETTTLDPKAEGYTFVIDEDIAAGDIVLYTYIDGVYYVELAEMVTDTIDKKGIDKKGETITCGDNVYEQSYIEHAEIEGMDCDITVADTQVSYDFYLDAFGYVRLYTVTGYNKGFVLLTDGYYATNGRTETFQATIFDRAAEELADVDVAAGKNTTAASNFIDTDENGDNGNRGTWNRLLVVDDVYFASTNKFLTNIAAFGAADDVYTLTAVENASNKTAYGVMELINIDVDDALTDETLTAGGTVAKIGASTVQTTEDTVYYLVVKNAKGKIAEILTWTGYENAPKTAALANDVVGYVVFEETDYTYEIADVVVFETSAADPYDMYFAYNYTGKLTNKNGFDALTIGYDEAEEAYDSAWKVDANQTLTGSETYTMPGFANISGNGVIDNITADFAAENIYAGTVRVAQDVQSRNYVIVEDTAAGELSFKPVNVPCYVVTYTAKNGYGIAEQDEAFVNGDEMIVVTNAKKAVQYVINVTQSTWKNNGVTSIVPELEKLYNGIVTDAQYVADPVLTVLDYINKTTGTATLNDGIYTYTWTAKAGQTATNIYAALSATDAAAKVTMKVADNGKSATITVTGLSADNTLVIQGSDKTDKFEVTVKDYNTDHASATTGTTGTKAYGTEVKFQATADAGYTVTEVTMNGTELTADEDGYYSFVVTANSEIVITAVAIDVAVDVVVKVGSTELSNLYVAPKTVKYGTDYTFALSEAKYVYVYNNSNFKAEVAQTVKIEGDEAATGAMTIVVAAYDYEAALHEAEKIVTAHVSEEITGDTENDKLNTLNIEVFTKTGVNVTAYTQKNNNDGTWTLTAELSFLGETRTVTWTWGTKTNA